MTTTRIALIAGIALLAIFVVIAAIAMDAGLIVFVALGQEDDDLVGLAEAVGAQDHAPVTEEAHRSARGRGLAGSRGQ